MARRDGDKSLHYVPAHHGQARTAIQPRGVRRVAARRVDHRDKPGDEDSLQHFDTMTDLARAAELTFEIDKSEPVIKGG